MYGWISIEMHKQYQTDKIVLNYVLHAVLQLAPLSVTINHAYRVG